MRLRVRMKCPACGFEFVGAVIDTETWWGKGATPAAAAKVPYCWRCNHPPPMLVVETPVDPEPPV